MTHIMIEDSPEGRWLLELIRNHKSVTVVGEKDAKQAVDKAAKAEKELAKENKIAEKAALRRSRMTEAQRKKADEKAAKKAAALAELWQKEQAKAKPFYEKMQKALGEDNI